MKEEVSLRTDVEIIVNILLSFSKTVTEICKRDPKEVHFSWW